MNALDVPSSMIQAQPLLPAWSFDIQRIARSPKGCFGASGQLEERVTSGIDNSARKASASSMFGARSRSRSVVRDGNSRSAFAISFEPWGIRVSDGSELF